jgi:hypothetical protein
LHRIKASVKLAINQVSCLLSTQVRAGLSTAPTAKSASRITILCRSVWTVPSVPDATKQFQIRISKSLFAVLTVYHTEVCVNWSKSLAKLDGPFNLHIVVHVQVIFFFLLCFPPFLSSFIAFLFPLIVINQKKKGEEKCCERKKST